LAFYKDRFADASNFTFFFVGSFDEAMIKPLIERYIASLPSLKRKESWKDIGVKTPTTVIERRVEKGIEPKSLSMILIHGSMVFDQQRRTVFHAMAQILEMRLLQSLREELGGTYSVSVIDSNAKYPKPEYSIGIRFGSSPDRTEDLIKRVFQEIEKFKTEGPTVKELTDEKEALLREFETNSQKNGYLLNQIATRYTYGEDPAIIWNSPETYKKLDAIAIKEAAKTYLNTSAYVRVSLFPEKK